VDRASVVELVKDWALALGITVVVLFAWQWMQPDPVEHGPAPSLVEVDLDGATWSLADVSQDVVVVNFWATWCGPCRDEIPELSAEGQRQAEVAFVGVSADDGLSTPILATKSKQLGVAYPVVHDRDLSTVRAWGVNTFPTTFVLDRERHVVATHIGMITGRGLEALVAKADAHGH